jgi:hypothetical protein
VPVPTQINGLPAHVLLIHVLLAAIPLGAVLVILHAVWPAARRRLGIVTPLVTLVALAFVPVTTNAGHWFKDHLNASGAWKERIDKHANLGGTLLPLAIALFVVAAGLWYLGRRYEYGLIRDRGAKGDAGRKVTGTAGGGSTATAVRTEPRASVRTALPTWANTVIGIVAVAVAVVTVVQLYRIGDSGAQAVWHGSVPGG